MIAVRALSVTHRRGRQVVEALRAVDLDVARGGALGLVGESGCGKTTLLRALAGLGGGARGQVRIDGAPLDSLDAKARARKVQMVFQDPLGSLHPRQTVAATLGEPLAVHGIGDRAARIVAALDRVGLDAGYRYRFPHQLSGGQRQRVAIARALMLEPEVLLLDEPTSALDVTTQAAILDLLGALRRSQGLTLVMVSHDLSVVAALCETVAVMRDGALIDRFPAAAIAAPGDRHPHTRALIEASGFLPVD